MNENQKIEPLLIAALNANEKELQESSELSEGFDPVTEKWEVIIRYTGTLSEIVSQYPNTTYINLFNGYGIIYAPKDLLPLIAINASVLYMEKPKRLYYELINGKRASCITSLPSGSSLDGSGIIVAVIDSGIDYTHPDFRNPDGTSRILFLWDQTIQPSRKNWKSPENYPLGTLFTSSMINDALNAPTPDRFDICPSIDLSGHGTAVAGIAAGNGSSSEGLYTGVASGSKLIVVKLGSPSPNGFPSTTQLMQAIDFCIRQAMELNIPISINLSFGNVYGSHSGTSLLETYIDSVSNLARTCITCASGNEGGGNGHTRGKFNPTRTGFNVIQDPPINIELSVGLFQTGLNLQIWKNYWDNISIELISPSGQLVALPSPEGTWRFPIGSTNIYATIGAPSPYSIFQEIYLEFTGENYLESGIWTIRLNPISIREGNFEMWLPGSAVRNPSTGFLSPSPDTTLTIPSTASKIITVGAYDSRNDQIAAFSGRGYTFSTGMIKPELVAPGVDITVPSPGGGYDIKSGTSMAAPFVAGSCALLMQWGILMGNDPYLYGEKMKAYLIRGTRPLPAYKNTPNPITGWGALCLRNSIL